MFHDHTTEQTSNSERKGGDFRAIYVPLDKYKQYNYQAFYITSRMEKLLMCAISRTTLLARGESTSIHHEMTHYNAILLVNAIKALSTDKLCFLNTTVKLEFLVSYSVEVCKYTKFIGVWGIFFKMLPLIRSRYYHRYHRLLRCSSVRNITRLRYSKKLGRSRRDVEQSFNQTSS